MATPAPFVFCANSQQSLTAALAAYPSRWSSWTIAAARAAANERTFDENEWVYRLDLLEVNLDAAMHCDSLTYEEPESEPESSTRLRSVPPLAAN